MALTQPMDPAVSGYVPANTYKFYVWNQPVSGSACTLTAHVVHSLTLRQPS